MKARHLLCFVLSLGGCGLSDVLSGKDEVSSSVAITPRPPLPAPGDPAGGSGDEAIPPEATFAEANEVAHSHLPMQPGMVWVYEGYDHLRFRRDVVRVLDGKRPILGVACTALSQEVTLDGRLVERTTLWYAQDDAGNVWQFGEESMDFSIGPVQITADSWEAGVDGNEPWMCLGADPRPGMVFAGIHSGHADAVVVRAVGVLADVPAGLFGDCLEVVESNPDDPEDEDLIIYAPGVGLVSEESISGRIELVSFSRG